MSENKYYFCDELNNVLSCFHDKIMSCCSGQSCPTYIRGYKGEKIKWDFFWKKKEEAFSLLNDDNIDYSPCKGCYFLRERKINDVISPKFKFINISNWTHCNCGCVYCARIPSSKGKIDTKPRRSEYYDMLPFLKQLYQQELLDRKELFVNIQGGDISVLKEFEPVVRECLKQGAREFYILSNNIKYQPIIKELIEADKTTFVTSLDCGNRDLYRKLKRVDKFNDSVENLKKYVSGNHPERVVVKYIVIRNFNDNTESITEFINLMSDIGIRNVDFMLDNKYINDTNMGTIPSPPSYYKDLYLHFKNLCEEKNLKLLVWDKLRDLINNQMLKE